jgi:ankyrin repeat protein
MATQKNPVSLVVVLVLLGGLGALLWYSINNLSGEIGRTPDSAGAAGIAAGGLHEAAERGDLTAIDRELSRGVDANAVAKGADVMRGEMTPLMYASFAGKTDAMKKLIQAGAKPDLRSKDGKTAIMLAAGWGDAAGVKTLLDAGARVDARTEDGLTAVMLAAARGTAESLKAIVDAGANVNVTNKWGETALLHACRSGDVAKIQTLLNSGATPDLKDNTGQTALTAACAGDATPEAITALLDAKADPNLADSDGVTPLMKAADRGDLEKVKLLLSRGASRTAKDNRGWTAESWADARDDEIGKAVVAELKKTK